MAPIRTPAVQSPAISLRTQYDIVGYCRSCKLLLGAFVGAMLTIHGFFFWSVRDLIARGAPDFTAYYSAGKIIREGQATRLYNAQKQAAVQFEFATPSESRRGPLSYIHPPFEALLFVPFSLLPYTISYVVWDLLGLFALAGAWQLLRTRIVSLRKFKLWQLMAISLAFFPIFANLHQGQDAILLLLIVALVFAALDQGSDFAAGCWLGLGLFKYQLILPLALILALQRGGKLLKGFLSVAAILVLISVGAVGWHAALQYPSYAWSVVSNPSLGGAPLRQLPSLQGLLAGWPIWNHVGWPGQLLNLLPVCQPVRVT